MNAFKSWLRNSESLVPFAVGDFLTLYWIAGICFLIWPDFDGDQARLSDLRWGIWMLFGAFWEIMSILGMFSNGIKWFVKNQVLAMILVVPWIAALYSLRAIGL